MSREKGQDSKDLLNFRFSTAPPTSETNQRQTRRPPKQRISKQDRTSARRKADSRMFYLHSSTSHAFVLTRRPPNMTQYSFSGSDEPVSWESVRIVKNFIQTENESCPICLDEYICPRVTKCGHVFCLPCLIKHSHSFVETHPYDKEGPKCPCCSIHLHLEDLRAVENIHCFQPTVNQHMRFVKLHKVKGCPSPFLPLMDTPRRSSPHAAPCQSDPDSLYCRFNYVDPFVYQSILVANMQDLDRFEIYSEADVICKQVATNMLQRQLTQSQTEMQEEMELMERYANPAAGFYQAQPPYLFAPSSSPRQQGNSLPESVERPNSFEQRPRGESLASEVSHTSTVSRSRGDSIASYETDGSPKRRALIRSTIFAGEDEGSLYQAENGCLYFLSKFNTKCLRADYSSTIADFHESSSRNCEKTHKYLPLPDSVEGRIVEIEWVNLNDEMRKRYRFLSHLPLHTDICFVEISLGDYLSNETKKIFRKEFQKRKQLRAEKAKAEKREDEKARRLEEARIRERKERMQLIDPDDEFFRPVIPEVEEENFLQGDDFGPSIGNARTGTHRSGPVDDVYSFSRITQSGGAFPALNSDESTFPSLGSSPRQRDQVTWGKPRVQQSVQPQPSSSGGKKKKGEKVVLFSTTSQRGKY